MKAFKEIVFAVLAMVCLSPFANAEEPAKSKAGFQLGNLLDAAPIPSTFGPFNSRTSGVGIYRGRLRITADDLKGDNKYLVIRMQNDKTHRFGWIRGFVGNQLVATEAQQKENRIVEDVTKWLKPGDSVITLMGCAYPGTSVDFYVVPKDTVLSVLQGKSLGNIVFTSGAIQASGKAQDSFGDSFDLTESELSGRLMLTVKAANSNGKAYNWVRGSINGTPIISEQNFSVGEGTVDISNYVKKGNNRIELLASANPGSVFGWYVTQLSRVVETAKVASSTAVKSTAASAPILSKTTSRDLKAGTSVDIFGRGFDKGSTKVRLDDITIVPSSVTEDKIVALIPKDVFTGQYRLSVESAGQRSDSLPVNVSGTPRVTSISPKECGVGTELEIHGENFSERQSELKVAIGGRAARVLSSSRQLILVLVPTLPAEPVDAPVKVSVAGVSSNDEITLRLTAE